MGWRKMAKRRAYTEHGKRFGWVLVHQSEQHGRGQVLAVVVEEGATHLEYDGVICDYQGWGEGAHIPNLSPVHPGTHIKTTRDDAQHVKQHMGSIFNQQLIRKRIVQRQRVLGETR